VYASVLSAFPKSFVHIVFQFSRMRDMWLLRYFSPLPPLCVTPNACTYMAGTAGSRAETRKRGRPPKSGERQVPVTASHAQSTCGGSSSVAGTLLEIPEDTNTTSKQKRNNKRQRKVPARLLNYVTPPASRQPRLSKVSTFQTSCPQMVVDMCFKLGRVHVPTPPVLNNEY
jgi:hypothetical protein